MVLDRSGILPIMILNCNIGTKLHAAYGLGNDPTRHSSVPENGKKIELATGTAPSVTLRTVYITA